MIFSNSSIQNIQGNATKYFSYKEAWTRIVKSQEQGFYLEAVTIEESIITDRLISYLVGIQAIERSENLQKYPNFARLINIWREKQPEPINIKINDQELIDRWRKRRNKVVHGIVKSHPGTATDNITDFIEEAKLTAKEGEILSRAVSRWVEKTK